MSTWTQKLAATGVKGAYFGPTSTSANVRQFPASLPDYPLRLCFDNAPVVGPGLPTLPDASYPAGAGVNRQASGADGFYVSTGTTWTYTEPLNYLITNKARDNSVGHGDANIVGEQQDSLHQFLYPYITTQFGDPCLAIPVPGKSDGANGGYFDTPFAGYDQTTVRIGPDNGAEIYFQMKYRTEEMIHNDFGGVSNGWGNTITKNLIFGHAPTNDASLDYFASENDMSSVMGWFSGFGDSQDGLHTGYNRSAGTGNDANGTQPFSNSTYVQDGTGCPYNPGSYSRPPCVGLEDDGWYTLTRRWKLQPVATNFSISGTTLTKTGAFAAANFTNLESGQEVGRQVYIVGHGYAFITVRGTNDHCTIDTNYDPGGGLSGLTVYISDYKNSILQDWVGDILVFDKSNVSVGWDYVSPGWGQFRLIAQQTNRTGTVDFTDGVAYYKEVIVSTSAIALPTRFEALAEQLPVGSFVQLDKNGTSTNGFNDTFLKGSQSGGPLSVPTPGPKDGSGGIWSYQSNLCYDSTTKRILGLGAAHAEVASDDPLLTQEEFTQYAITTDAWSRTHLADAIFQSNGNVENGHSYDQNAIDVVNREGYFMLRTDSPVYRYDLDSLHVISISQPNPTHGFGNGEGSLVYFPERGKLLRLRSDSLCEWTRGSNTWADVTDPAYINLTYIGDRGPIARYSPVRGFCIFFGGRLSADSTYTGNRRGVIKYDSAGAYSFLPNVPSSVTIYPQSAVHWIDPITGNLLLIAAIQPAGQVDQWAGTIEFWELDLTPGAEVWNQLDDTVIPAVSGWWELPANNIGTGPSGVISVDVPEYGVAVLASCEVSGLNETAYIYRHGEGANLLPTPEPEPEPTPTPPQPVPIRRLVFQVRK